MMARYIDADALLDHIPNLYERREVARWVDEQPTAPVREVVLCKDCKHNPKDTWFECPMAGLSEKQRPETAWCWRGERRDG